MGTLELILFAILGADIWMLADVLRTKRWVGLPHIATVLIAWAWARAMPSPGAEVAFLFLAAVMPVLYAFQRGRRQPAAAAGAKAGRQSVSRQGR